MRDPLQSRMGREEKRKVRMLSRPPKAPLLASKLKTAMWGSDSFVGVGKGLPASPPLSAPSFSSLSGQGHSPSTAQQKQEFRKGNRALSPRHHTRTNHNPLIGIAALGVLFVGSVLPENTKEDKELKSKW